MPTEVTYIAHLPDGKATYLTAANTLRYTHAVFVKPSSHLLPWEFFCMVESRDQATIAIGQLLFTGQHVGYFIAPLTRYSEERK